jgi:hypothetical protein
MKSESEAGGAGGLLVVVGLLYRRPAEPTLASVPWRKGQAGGRQVQLAFTHGGNLMDVWQALAGTGAAL